MKQDKWTQQLHDKLAEHETAAPDGLWDDIEAALADSGSLGQQEDSSEQEHPQVSQPGRTRFVALRRWAAAAAVAAILAGGGLVWLAEKSQTPPLTPPLEGRGTAALEKPQATESLIAKQEEPLIAKQEEPLTAKQDGEQVAKQDGALTAKREEPLTGRLEQPQTGQQEETLTGRLEQSQTDKQEQPQTDGQEQLLTDRPEQPQMAKQEQPRRGDEITGRGETPVGAATNVSPERATEGKTYTPTNHHQRQTRPQRHSQPSLNLYAMNGLMTKENSNAVVMADELARNYTSTFDASNLPAASRQPFEEPIFLSGYEEQQHHSQPVAFGLSVDYPLSDHLSLTSGVVYTRLRSDFTRIIHSQQISQEQTLHYVGIPLGLNYRLLQHGAFKAYVAAGVQADWNVATRLNTEGVESKMSRDRMQWSVNASIGVQYNLLPQLALYAEPGLNHYFDNGSNVQNFFKDKPTSLRLQFGLRLTIDR